jgi:hypothetical protein
MICAASLVASCATDSKPQSDAVAKAEAGASAIESAADSSCPSHAALIHATAASMRTSIQIGIPAIYWTSDVDELTRLAQACKVERDFATAQQNAASFVASAHSRCPHELGEIEKHQMDLQEAIQGGWGADAAKSSVEALAEDKWSCEREETECGAGPARIGMTKDRAIHTSWCFPEKVNTTETAGDIHEQWVYPNGGYLYFDNGRLTSIQDFQ